MPKCLPFYIFVQESDRNFSEQMEKARLRHKHARSKLMLEKVSLLYCFSENWMHPKNNESIKKSSAIFA